MNFDGRKQCARCRGAGRISDATFSLCFDCKGIGKVFEQGGPEFGCAITLADRNPGELVLLATGHRARVQWHAPRDEPETTFVALISDFDDAEERNPVPVSSKLGVREVIESRMARGKRNDDGAGAKEADPNDPMMRNRGKDLM